jgi:hypothetical protein
MGGRDFPRVEQEFFELKGGLDQLTPPISMPPGKVFDAQNFEPEISGGYRRIDGYERYDGRTSPTSASYWTLTFNQTGTVTIGGTVTGPSGSATVLAQADSTLVLGRLTGSFANGDSLTGGAVGTATASAILSGASTQSLDADYMLLAANDLRNDIGQVPGSGRIRGVFVFNDVVYAFRDNIGATAQNLYKSTAGGWVQVAFATEVAFTSTTGGGTKIQVGQTIGNAAVPTKTATVLAVLTRSGTWGTDAVGTLVITPVLGSFANTDPIYVGATQLATATANAASITRQPGGGGASSLGTTGTTGQVETVQANFGGATGTRKVYGADGVNTAFEFDGTTYVPIHTGMATDTPTHVQAHRNYLWLSFGASLQFSSIGQPYSWTAILGAGEISAGDTITGLLPQGGNSAGGAMAVFTSGRTHILYGTSSSNFQLVTSIFDLGYSAFTVQPISNTTYGLTARGVQGLITTLTYGDFDFDSVTHLVQTLITSKRGQEIASTSSRTKNQYRLYWADGTGIVIGLTGDSVAGIMPLSYGKAVRCITTTTLSTGSEVTYFGSDDGYVYRDGIGTSFDGQPIEAWLRLVFNHSKSPQIRKSYKHIALEVKATSYVSLQFAYELGYGSPNVSPPDQTAVTMLGGGGFWDQFTWDQFTWDAPYIEEPRLSISGTEKNISLFFYSNRAQDRAFTLQGVSLSYILRRAER